MVHSTSGYYGSTNQDFEDDEIHAIGCSVWFLCRASFRLSLATEVVDNTQNKMHCLKFGTGLDDLSMKPQVERGGIGLGLRDFQ